MSEGAVLFIAHVHDIINCMTMVRICIAYSGN